MDDTRDFFAFRVMVTPALMKVAWAVIAVASTVAGLIALVRGELGVGAVLILAVPLASRIVFELAIVTFAIHENLTHIRRVIVGQGQPGP